MGIMAAAAGRFCCMDAGGILGDYVAVAIAATGCAGSWLYARVIVGNSVVAGCTAELGMSGMAEFFWIDIIQVAYLCLISVACDAGFVFACAVTKRIIGGLDLISRCNAEHNEQ